MKISVCHYSFHRTWAAEKWTCERLAQAVKDLGADGVDFHAGLLGSTAAAAAKIKAALRKTGLTLSGLSVSNDFNVESDADFKKQVDTVIAWLRVAAEVRAPVSRIFGAGIKDRNDRAAFRACRERVLKGLRIVVKEAEKLGVVFALENHGGFPCTGEEQVEVIRTINSPSLRATIDVGNYMNGGQEGHVGSAIAAPYAAYVHFKDFVKAPDSRSPWGWGIHACTVGKGAVNHRECLQALKNAGYDGFVALEYEGPEDEKIGVAESMTYTKDVMKGF